MFIFTLYEHFIALVLFGLDELPHILPRDPGPTSTHLLHLVALKIHMPSFRVVEVWKRPWFFFEGLFRSSRGEAISTGGASAFFFSQLSI